jgi:hypothetical protein
VSAAFKAGVVTALLSTVLLSSTGFMLGVYSGRRPDRGWAPTPYLAFSRTLPQGHQLGADDVKVDTVPEQFLGPNAVPVSEQRRLTGRRLEVPVHAGEPVSRAVFVPRPVSLACGGAAHVLAETHGRSEDPTVRGFLLALDGALATQKPVAP